VPASEKSSSKTVKASPEAIVLKPQTTCPIMNEPINKKFFVDYQGKRIYACCGMCPDQIKADPEKYIKKLEAMGQGVEVLPIDKSADTLKTKQAPATKHKDSENKKNK